MTNSFDLSRQMLRGSVSSAALLLSLAATPAFAQTAGDQTTATSAATNPQAQAGIQGDQTSDTATQDVVVTGTLFRRTDTETPSPVTVLTADNLQKRGINTVADAVNSLSANGSGTINNSWNAQGNFAQGASAVSLRGLTTSSTLVLFDGLRTAFYPLADDGSRNFVDLNTIPDAIVDRVEVLKDGASSTYGADAIAGVVNIITKKQITGVSLNASAGISQRGDAAEQRLDLTAGYGDLDEKGFNVYVNGEYQKDHALLNSDRGYPFNTSDLSRLCGTSLGRDAGSLSASDPGYPAGATVCRTNGVAGGVQFDGTFAGQGTTLVPVVRPYDATNTTAVPGSRYQLLNPGLGCQGLSSVVLSGTQLTNGAGPNGATNGGANASPLQCQLDTVNAYGTIIPQTERIGASAHATVKIGDNSQAYALFNYYQTKVGYSTTPQSIRNITPAGGNQYSTATLALPVFVCPRGTTAACTAANGTLNPNNPFAAQGQVARILYRLSDIPSYNESFSHTYRGAIGISGTFGNDWGYSADLTGSHIDLDITSRGYIYVQHLLDEVADGSYNFVNPSQNSQAVRDYLAPTNKTRSTSDLYQGQASITKSLFTLPGGPLQVAVGGAVRYEKNNAPSANPVIDGDTLGTQRYFTLNGVGASGHRYVESGYFEVHAPVFDQLEIDGSGRYDHYSSGQSNFSPKVGAKFTPIRQLAIRGTYSRGFRIPSFNEANGLPTTGYITSQVTDPAFIAAHGGNAYSTGQYSIGLTTTGTPGLKPEKARNFTGGVIFEPVPWATVTADYYNIKKTDLIVGADYGPAIAAYYANNGVVNIPGLTVVPGTADPDHPGALPLLGFIQYGYQNANSLKTSGLDLTGEIRTPLIGGIKLTSTVEATYVIKYTTTYPSGTQRYDGTLGPCNITSCSGTPKWRGNWQNTLDFGGGTLSATAYYTSGYEGEAEDYAGIRYDCLDSFGASIAVYRDNATPVRCKTKRFIDVDLSGSIDINDRFSLYGNILNVFDVKPSYDPNTYGGYQYNGAWSNAGIIGRYFRIGARAKF